MTTLTFTHPDTGVVYRPPRLVLYAASTVCGEAGQADWSCPRPQSHLQPVRMSWGCNGRLSTLRARCLLGQGPTQGLPRHVDDAPSRRAGDRLLLRESAPDGREIEWFRGSIAQQELLVQSSDDVESVQYVAYGPEVLLRGLVVSGQWHKLPAADESEIHGELPPQQCTRESTFGGYLRVIFNESGRPNASQSAWSLLTRGDSQRACRVFEPPGRRVSLAGGTTIEAEYWTAYAALRSLVEYVDDGQVLSSAATVWDAIAATLDATPIAEVNVEGLNLLEAIAAILLPVGFGFAVEPWARTDEDGLARHALLVFPLHRPAGDDSGIARPYMAPLTSSRPTTADLEGRRSEVQRLHVVRDNHQVCNAVTVIGDQRRLQVCLEFHADPQTRDLHPCWDRTDSANDLQTYADPYGNVGGGGWASVQAHADFAACFDTWSHENYHVFRSFAWNEDGALSGLVCDEQGKAVLPDLSAFGVGEEDDFLRRPRPVSATFTCTAPSGAAQVYPARVEIAIDSAEDSWIRVPCVRIWSDRAGFTIDHPRIHLWRPYHDAADALKNDYGHYTYLTLLNHALRGTSPRIRLRLFGSVECDRAVVGQAPRGGSSSWPLSTHRVVRADDRFRWRDVLDQPLDASLPTTVTDYESTRESIGAYARRIRDSAEDALVHGSITLRYLARPQRYPVGTGLAGTAGRNISLQAAATSAYVPLIAGVNWDFAEGVNKTELLLDTPLLQVTR